MELTYDGVDLHDLGEITVSSATEYEGGEAPVRAKRTLTVTLDVFEDTFASNHALLQQVKAALKVQHGVLRWADEDTATVFVEQPAVVVSENFPDDPNSWGRYHQQLVVVFSFFEQDLTTGSAGVTLSEGTTTIELPEMTNWTETLAWERFSPRHSEVKSLVVRLKVSGLTLADTTLPLDDRREQLQATRDTWKSGLAGLKEVLLEHGTFSETVRIEEFEAEVNQAVSAIGWSFTANYTLLPDEGDYAIAEYKVTERNGDNTSATGIAAVGTGEQFLTISGTVTASSEAAALSRINAIRNEQVLAKSYHLGEPLRHEIESGHATGGTETNGVIFIEKTFTIELRKFRTDNQTLTLQKTGTAAVVNFGAVLEFTDGYNARRFADQRSQRSLAQGRLEFRGSLWLGALSLTVAGRRALLKQRVQEMHTAVNGADGRLIFGSYFDGTVRVEDFQPKVNQKLTGIDWALTCTYSKFPLEAGYATVELSVDQAEDVESGDATLNFTGRIQATTETVARAKLESVRTAVLAQYGYAAKQQLRVQSTAQKVFANGDKTSGISEATDGTTFTELNFSESYRKRMSTVLSSTLRVSDAESDREGFIITTYSGDVTAAGATAAAAYAAALAKAQSLGDAKYPPGGFRLQADVTWTQRQTTADNDMEFVRLEFSYEYQRKDGDRAYAEIATTTGTVKFGNDSETISGWISAADMATAQEHYLTLVKNALSTRLILDESVTYGTQQIQSSGSFGTAQFTRLEFRLDLYKRRATATQAIRYAVDTEKDWLTLTQRTTVSGSCWAATETEARSNVTGFLGTLGLGSPVRTRDNASLLRWEKASSTGSEFGQLDFEETYETRLTGAAGILSCEVTEELEYSGIRWVEQPLPRDSTGAGGVSLFQDCGLNPGKRTVRGSVRASTLAVCRAWATAQRTAFITGTYELPPQQSAQYVFAPRIEGVTAGISANVQMVLLTFTFSEWLPENAYA